jgi:segregation and condensation protein A
MQAETEDWSEPERLAPLDRVAAEALIVDVAGFEGPLDLLLTLSRTQKVDLRKISVLQLAEQYLEFVNKTLALRLELAADYLVMAAWLAYLKSRLLLPPEPGEDGPSAEELAAHLAYQLERLAAMREAAARLMGRDRLGRNFFARGAPESVSQRKTVKWEATLLDLMRAYARIRTRDEFRPFVMDRDNVFTMEQALERMRGLISYAGDWSDLTSFLPDGWDVSPIRRRSSTAAHFAAVLELAKAGKVSLRQGETFAPLMIRRRDPA